MTRRHVIAVAVGLAAIVVALVPPLWVRTTGDEVTLALRPVEPLSLFRGNYVDLAYAVEGDVPAGVERGETVFVVFDDARPANVVRVGASVPDLDAGQRCLRGRLQGDGIAFPELEQYFVTADQGRELETRLDDMVGVIRATGGCRGVLVSVEPR